jgi:VIT1/CCC1 family predicted Fe2+/Mn2+ transporter
MSHPKLERAGHGTPDPDQKQANRVAAILGAADGLTIVVALVFGRNPAVFHAALDAGIGEFVGMGAALYLSDVRKRIIPAFLCGACTLLGCVIPALPYIFNHGDIARISSGIIAVGLGAIVCKLRPEKGWLAIAETYGVLLVSGLLCFAVSLL